MFRTEVIEPATWFHDAKAVTGTLIDGSALWNGIRPGVGIKFFAGQSDPNDPSHFSIEFEKDGKREVLDCWLLDAGPVWNNPNATTPNEQIKVVRHPK